MIHMYSSIAYLDLAKRHRIALVEDASQAHGASWHGRHIGSFGEISIFSTQQSKLLTSGEGGLCVTDDPILYSRMQQMRADGRRYRTEPFRLSVEGNEVQSSSETGIHGRNTIAPDGYELEAVGDVPLFLGLRQVVFQNPIDDSQPGPQLGLHHRFLPLVTRRKRIRQHLPDGLTRQPELPRRLPPAHPVHLNGSSYPRIHFHLVHLPGVS